MEKQVSSRRDFVKKAAYVAPVILTLAAAPDYVKAGSYKDFKRDKHPWPRKGKEGR